MATEISGLCATCKHASTLIVEEPCQSCITVKGRPKWESKNANLRATMDALIMGTGVLKTEWVDPKIYFIGTVSGERAVPGETEPGMKFDGGKRDFTLLPWASVEEIVKVLEFGAQKYERDNWKKVEDAQHRYTKAALRHLVAYTQGEVNDPESGLPHLAHLGCCVLFLLDPK